MFTTIAPTTKTTKPILEAAALTCPSTSRPRRSFRDFLDILMRTLSAFNA